MKNHINYMGLINKLILVMLLLMISYLGFSSVDFLFRDEKPIRISVTAIGELNLICSGSFKDVVANKYYVYAKCVDGKPVTIQNYSEK